MLGAVLGSLLCLAGCGSAESSEALETLGSSQEPLTWSNLTLNKGWSAANGTTPAVTKVGNIIVFRGAFKGDPNVVKDDPFVLPPAYRPVVTGGGGPSVDLRVTMSGNAGGTLKFFNNNTVGAYETHLIQDGLAGPGPQALTFTSLDGVSIDVYRGIEAATIWGGQYSYRLDSHPATWQKINGFVRFEGELTDSDYKAAGDMFLFSLPSGQGVVPGQDVYVPVTLCPGIHPHGVSGTYGRLHIYPTGAVYVEPEGVDTPAADCTTSLEGTGYSMTTGGTTLTLGTGWTALSSRAVKVRNDSGVIRFEGAVHNGTSTTVATLPTGMRPAQTIYVVADGYGAMHLRLIIDSAGKVKVDDSMLGLAAEALSLDGVSFAF